MFLYSVLDLEFGCYRVDRGILSKIDRFVSWLSTLWITIVLGAFAIMVAALLVLCKETGFFYP